MPIDLKRTISSVTSLGSLRLRVSIRMVHNVCYSYMK
jgi:hypothetical protein